MQDHLLGKWLDLTPAREGRDRQLPDFSHGALLQDGRAREDLVPLCDLDETAPDPSDAQGSAARELERPGKEPAEESEEV